MEAYINGMVEKSPHRPVLQFNRIDFRLPWFKKHYPHAKFLHLYRNPRDQWCSFLIDKEKMNKDDVETTYRDAFYLDVWCDDLVVHYPFLSKKVTPHPYQRFYYLWKLSFLVGQKHCDISISFEQLTDNPTEIISSIFKAFGISENYVATAAGVIQKPTKNRWKSYANNDWFKHHELICERYLTRFLDK
jgi:hypothetical protein